jgi:hypothetical protein
MNYIFLEESVPRFGVSPRLPVKGHINDEMSFECNVAIDVMDKVNNVSILWRFGNVSTPIPADRTKIEDRSKTLGRSLLVYSRLTLIDLQPQFAGKYYCVAELQVENARGNPIFSTNQFFKTIQLDKG